MIEKAESVEKLRQKCCIILSLSGQLFSPVYLLMTHNDVQGKEVLLREDHRLIAVME
jgi:hypothetical protein